MSAPRNRPADVDELTHRPGSGPPPPRRRPGDDTDEDQLATLWPGSGRGILLLGVLVAVLTAVGATAGNEQDEVVALGILHVSMALATAIQPTAIRLQVAAGVALAASMLLGVDGTAVAAVPVVIGVVATTELLGLALQMRIVVPRDPRPGMRRVALTTAAGAVAATVTLAAGSLDGPAGLAATLLAAGGCVGFVALLRGNPGQRGEPGT